VKAGQAPDRKTATGKGEIMPQYLVAIHHPDGYDGSLSAASSAKSLRAQSNGKVLITDGPYLETKEHIGGFWILEAANLEEALEWGRKAVIACRVPVEVRAFL
jgi:hypothetical protein